MIEYEIKGVAPRSLIQEIGHRFRRPQQQQGQVLRPALDGTWRDDKTQRNYWGKIRFIHWIEEIKKSYKPGELVTHHSHPINETEGPSFYGAIEWINELHYNSPVESSTLLPEVLFCRMNTNMRFTYTPKQLRKLTPKEQALVLVRDKGEGIFAPKDPN
jgi:hypothetical protein